MRTLFFIWSLIVAAALIVQCQRPFLMESALLKTLTFLNTFNRCAQLCAATGEMSCVSPVDITVGCFSLTATPSIFNFMECNAANNIFIVSFLRAGLAVLISLLLLPILSIIFSSRLWPSPQNPIVLFLHTLRHLSPEHHRICCTSSAAVVAAFSAVSFLIYCFASFISIKIDTASCIAYQQCKYAALSFVVYRGFNNLAMYCFLSLTPTAMVAAYAYVSFIARARVDAFVCLVTSLVAMLTHDARLLHANGAGADSDSKASEAEPSLHAGARLELLQLLHVCRCPDAVLAQMYPLLSSAQSVKCSDVASVLWPRLQSLWMIQTRDITTLTKHNEKWLVCQAAIVITLIIPTALFMSIGLSIFPSFRADAYGILVAYFMFGIPFFAAILLMALGQFYVERACDRLSRLLETCSESAERKHHELPHAFDGSDSLAATVTFCRSTSQRTFCLGTAQITWQAVLRAFYYMGFVLFAIASSLSNPYALLN